MSDFLSTYRDYAAAQRRDAEAARATLMRALKAEGVTRVEVEFDGSGDSGSIEAPVFSPSVAKNFVKKEVPDTVFESTDWSDGTPKKVKRNKTIGDLIDDVCYGILGSEHGGWEINEGSFGRFMIWVEKGVVNLEYNQRVESYESYEEEY